MTPRVTLLDSHPDYVITIYTNSTQGRAIHIGEEDDVETIVTKLRQMADEIQRRNAH